MIWLVPLGVGAAIVAYALLSSSSAAADTSTGGTTGGSSTGGSTGGGTTGGTTGGSRTGGSTGGAVEEPLPILIGLPSLLGKTELPEPTPNHYYRIKSGDMGSSIALKAYNGDKPTHDWIHVAADPLNVSNLGTDSSSWFLPRWDDSGLENTGSYTGKYAKVWLPAVLP